MIIGVLIAATISAKALIKNSRIAAAQAKTRAAPINSIPDATIWLESSLEESFSSDEAEDGSEITGWKDIKSGSAQSENNADSGSSNAPIYSNTINSIQAVKFDKGDDTYFNVNAVNLNKSDYTIFFLEKRQSTGSNYLLGDSDTLSGGSSAANENETLVLGYSADGTIIHSQGGSNSYTASVDAYASSNENPRIITFVQNASTGKKIYINGFLAAESTNTDQLSNIATIKLGKGYTGEIGEFVVFNRALKGEERKSIEKYLQEKWRMSVNSISTTAESCGGEITATSGCDMSTAPCNGFTIAGSSKTSSDATNDGSATCDDPNYSGTAEFTCINGNFTETVSCTPAAPCNSVAIVGISDTGTLAHLATSSSTCNATGYDSSTTLDYTCNDGSLTVTSTPSSCSCASNFAGATCNACATGFADISGNPNCTSCDTAGGYVSDGSGGCRVANNCSAGGTIAGATATTDAKNHLETGTLTCDATGYDGGSVTYTCNDGTASADPGCSCNTGYDEASGCTTCATGYSDTDPGSAVVCEPVCSLPSMDGITAGSIVNQGETSFACNETGYRGTLTFSACVGGETLSVTGECYQPLECSGGSITDIDTNSDGIDDRRVHQFVYSTSTQTFSCSSGDTTNDMKYLLVGPGGKGGTGYDHSSLHKCPGGGGGGGQVVQVNGATLASGDSITVSIGRATQSGNTPYSSVISGSISNSAGYGGWGGTGGYYVYGEEHAGNGGSSAGGGSGGGGSGGYDCKDSVTGNAGSGSPNGGTGTEGSGTHERLARGGNNTTVSNITGSNVTYGAAGLGGKLTVAHHGVAAAANTGSGGGGGGGGGNPSGSASSYAGAGADGVFIISYPY